MSIHPPNWAKHAIPTHSGWRDPRTNELYVSGSITQNDINSYMGIAEEVVHEIAHESVDEGPVQLNEAPPHQKSMTEMSKRELENLGRQHGVELDRRHNKKTLVQHLKEVIE